jgi:hypothetical protein
MADFLEEFEADADGHTYSWDVGERRDLAICRVEFAKGMGPQIVGGILRKLADLIERNPSLLNMPQGTRGNIVKGEIEVNPLTQNMYDDFGNMLPLDDIHRPDEPMLPPDEPTK